MKHINHLFFYLELSSPQHAHLTRVNASYFRAKTVKKPAGNRIFDCRIIHQRDRFVSQRSQRTFHPGMGGPRVSCVHLCFPTLLAESAQSVIQVKPTGSALMRIGSALSLEAGRAYRVYVGHRKRKRTLSNTLEILRNSLRDAARHSKEYIYPSIMTQLSGSGFLSGVLGWDF